MNRAAFAILYSIKRCFSDIQAFNPFGHIAL